MNRKELAAVVVAILVAIGLPMVSFGLGAYWQMGQDDSQADDGDTVVNQANVTHTNVTNVTEIVHVHKHIHVHKSVSITNSSPEHHHHVHNETDQKNASADAGGYYDHR